MPFLEHADAGGRCSLFYRLVGAGPLLVLLHNGFYSSKSWDALLPQLSQNFSCLVWDRQGYGQSGAIPGHETTIEGGVAELDSLLAALQAQGIATRAPHLWGHCLGAAIAVAWNAAHPGRAASLFLEACGFYSDPEIRRRADLISRPWEKIPTALRLTMEAMHSPQRAPAVWAAIIEHTGSYIIDPDYDLRPALAAIRAKCLVANGDRDLYFSRRHAESGAAHIHACQLWLPDNFGHDMHLEQPAALLSRHAEFVNGPKKSL